jgi:hypothetical protein
VSTHAIAAPADIDHCSAVQKAVNDGGGDHGIGEDLAPVTEATIRREDDRTFLVASTDDFEDPVGRGLVKRQVAELVDDKD